MTRVNFKQRFTSNRIAACGDVFLAVFSLVVLFSSLRHYFESPALWVLANVVSATFIFMMVIGREGTIPGILIAFLFVCMGIITVYMLFDGIYIAPLLMAIFTFDAWKQCRAGTKTPMDEVISVFYAVMAAGVPALAVNAWSNSSKPAEAIMAFVFYIALAWFSLYPPREWVQGYTPPSENKEMPK